ncbi:MAG: hypothetical protein RIA69_10825 [Cyclobacteriaceae bacterium]
MQSITPSLILYRINFGRVKGTLNQKINDMQKKRNLYNLCLALLAFSILGISSCGEDEDTGDGADLPNEVSMTSASSLTVTEKDTTITLTYEFIIATRESGSLEINATVEDLSYGVNYSTTPAETTGVISVPFTEGATTVSFQIAVNDDDQNLPNGKVTFTLAEVTGESSSITTSSASFALTILDNEGESIVPTSDETLALGESVPGAAQEEAVEVTFTSLNIVTDISATATDGFLIGATAEGDFASTQSLASDATSFFVKASPDATAALGLLSGSVTLTSGEATTAFPVETIVSSAIGQLFWVENFDYPVDDTYPSYGENGENWGIVPVSANYRFISVYNGADPTLEKIRGQDRVGVLDTWYTQNPRLTGIGMGDNPLSFTGYPGSGVGRTMRFAFDVSNYAQRNDCKEEGAFLGKNSVILRRIADDGNEIKSGNVYVSTMIKVNEVFPEETPILKNAIFMLTGDATYVNSEAMKLNVRDDGAGGFNFGVSKSSDDGSVVYGATSYEIGTTYAIVFKVEINEDLEGEDPNDVVSVYVFEEGATIPNFENSSLVAEAVINKDNQEADVHDVVNGLELFYAREVADVFAAGGPDNINVQDVEISGIRVATSWNALFKSESDALWDSQSADELQELKNGRADCSGPGVKNANNDE